MRRTALRASLTVAFDGGPLAVVDGLPGDHAELRPAQMRELAAALRGRRRRACGLPRLPLNPEAAKR